jgi:carbamate kinase
MKLLIALGGNAIKQANEKGTAEEQLHNCAITTKQIAKIVQGMKAEDRLIITHGNGPQAGNLLVQQDAGKNQVPAQPMDIVGAMTQGQIGYMLQSTLMEALSELNIHTPVCSIINRVRVDKDDPEFSGDTASKPVGNFLTESEADEIKTVHPEYIIKKVKPNGDRAWRRTVPSPDPIENVEREAIRKMVDAGIIVIASGGGGIPVVSDGNNQLTGVEAVIDKDLAGERLAEVVEADIFLILTDVEKVKINFAKDGETDLDTITVPQAKSFYGQFLAGSMGPKVMACIRFLEWGGRKAIITSLDKAQEALEGETGTHILLD